MHTYSTAVLSIARVARCVACYSAVANSSPRRPFSGCGELMQAGQKPQLLLSCFPSRCVPGATVAQPTLPARCSILCSKQIVALLNRNSRCKLATRPPFPPSSVQGQNQNICSTHSFPLLHPPIFHHNLLNNRRTDQLHRMFGGSTHN